MARRLGLSLSGYKFWESGDRTPSGGWILKLRALCPDDRAPALFCPEEPRTRVPDINPGPDAHVRGAREGPHLPRVTVSHPAPATRKENITETVTQTARK